jgi:hypothetical protein
MLKVACGRWKLPRPADLKERVRRLPRSGRGVWAIPHQSWTTAGRDRPIAAGDPTQRLSNCESNQRADKRARRLFGYFVGCREKDEPWHDRRKRQELKGFF